jgi:Ni/Co efflux regulator RcnB
MTEHAKTLPRLAAALALLAAIPAHAGNADTDARPQIGTPPIMQTPRVEDKRWVALADGRWQAGTQAPGGWAAYERPYRGFALPEYWRASSFQLANHAHERLPAPARGQRWSRYYNDAVLTDSRGHVVDMRIDHDWSGTPGKTSLNSGALSDPDGRSVVTATRQMAGRADG